MSPSPSEHAVVKQAISSRVTGQVPYQDSTSPVTALIRTWQHGRFSSPLKTRGQSGPLGIPSLKRLLHGWICEECETHIVLDRSIDDALHVGALYNLRRGNLNLRAEAGRVCNRRAEHHAVEASPQDAAHTHRARLAGSVERVTPQRIRADLVAC